MQLSGNVTRFDWSDPTKVSVTWGVFGHGKYAFQIRDYFYDSLASVTLDVCFNEWVQSYSSPESHSMLRISARRNRSSHMIQHSFRSIRMAKSCSKSFNTLDLIEPDTTRLLSLPSLYTFTMEHNIDYGYQYPAPDDQYTFSVLTFVIEPATNESIPILELLLFDSGPGDLTTETNVTRHLTSQFTYDAGSGPTTVVAISEALHVTIVRSASARVLTYSVFAINWILEFCSVITTIAAFSRRGGKSDVGITLLPVTVVLSIPAIRNLFVGSPPFGIYLGAYENRGTPLLLIENILSDVVGFFPQMLIVASCTAVILSGHVLKSIWGEGARTKEKRGLRPKDIQ